MSKPKVIIGAVLARCPRAFAGHTCSTMNWALGLRELGWDVWLAEHIDDSELEAPEAPGLRSPQEEFWFKITAEYGFADRQCLLVNGKSPDLEAFQEFTSDAELFLNYSGQYKRLDLMGPRVVKAYLDVDPGFTQLWVEVCNSDMNFEGHDVFLTVGTTLHTDFALVPKAGREWIPTLPPVVGDYWRSRLCQKIPNDPTAAWTAIGHWYGYHMLEWEGRTYGGKRESFLQFTDLPRLVPQTCVIASDIAPDWEDYPAFADAGWKFFPSKVACENVDTYLKYISECRGELGIAKEGYVNSRGGWMSDRSVVYLALGKPVVIQDTGWTHAVPAQPGMLPFQTLKEFAAAVLEIESDYARHAAAARVLADTVFSPSAVISPLLARIL